VSNRVCNPSLGFSPVCSLGFSRASNLEYSRGQYLRGASSRPKAGAEPPLPSGLVTSVRVAAEGYGPNV